MKTDPLNILIVDDDPDDFLITKDLLSDSPHQFKVEWCSNFQAALKVIAEKRHDVYFFDYHLGPDSGHQLLIEAKTLGLDKPIIMLTGNGDYNADAMALQAGAADYLVKGSITTMMLERSIRHALERTRILKELEDQISETNTLALVVSHTDNMVIITNAQGQVEWVNKSFANITGFSLEEIKGQKPGHFLQGPDTDSNTKQYISERMRQGLGFHCEILNYTKSKTPYWARINAQAIYDQQGRLSRFFAIESDITESKRAEQALREAEAQQRAILEAIPDIIFIIDKDGRYLKSKGSYDAPLLQDPVGLTIDQLPYISPELAKQTKEYIQESLNNGQVISYEYKIQEPHAETYYEGRIVPIDKERVLFLARDITMRKQSEAALKESEERYALAAKGANDGLWDWDIEENKVYYSSRWKAMLGYSEGDIGNTLDEWLNRVHPEDAERVQEELEYHLEGLSQSFESEHRVLHKDGSYRWMLSRALAIRNEKGQAERMTGWQTDSSGRVASYDALTNLPNRTLFLDRLRRALARTKRNPEHKFAVLYIDLDSFKFINDTLGHASGDLLLVEASKRLQHSLRQSDKVARMSSDRTMQDTVARFGGDEFAILIEEFHHLSDVIMVVERLQETLSKAYPLASQHAFSTASIGVALGHPNYQNPEEILRDADIAMYRAKHDGKARYALFDNNMHQEIKARFSLESDLRQALTQKEFRVYYQPIVDLKENRIRGFEALLRWQRSDKIISPAEFIPLSEETGIIVPLEAWLLEEALRQLKVWQRINPELTVSVNISGRHFESLDLITHIEQAISKSGIAASYLALEVTEGILNRQEERVRHMLDKLREMGICIYLDDFGTGYSSLSRLHALPVDVLKIDRSFMFGIETTHEKTNMVEAILLMASAMNLQVIAEGIETTQQRQLLKTLGCHYGQGYLFSRPVSAEKIEPLLEGISLEKTS